MQQIHDFHGLCAAFPSLQLMRFPFNPFLFPSLLHNCFKALQIPRNARANCLEFLIPESCSIKLTIPDGTDVIPFSWMLGGLKGHPYNPVACKRKIPAVFLAPQAAQGETSLELCRGSFRLDIREHFFTGRVAKGQALHHHPWKC